MFTRETVDEIQEALKKSYEVEDEEDEESIFTCITTVFLYLTLISRQISKTTG